jgi:hypothetical protein
MTTPVTRAAVEEKTETVTGMETVPMVTVNKETTDVRNELPRQSVKVMAE